MTHLLLCTVGEAVLDRIEPLRRSIEAQGVDALLLVVVRESASPGIATEAGVVWKRITGPAGLSRARNVGLAHARAEGLLAAAAFVHFADDDEVLAPGTLRRVEQAFAAHPWAGVVIGSYGPTVEEVDRRRWPDQPGELTVWEVPIRTSSATAHYRASVVQEVGDFDERFGLGARYAAGEDVDYAFRAMAGGARFRYEPAAVVLHPYRAGNPNRNHPGNMAMFAKHATRSRAHARMLWRTARDAVRQVRAGTMPLRTCLAGLRAAAGSLIVGAVRR